MVIGADVTHSAPNDPIEGHRDGLTVECSIAALVATLDKEFMYYHTETCVQQKEREEMITGIGTMFERVLEVFFRRNKFLPAHIIYYRDGVSEGQFASVLREEANALKDILKLEKFIKGHPGYAPKLTVITVQKRHHTRFIPLNPADGGKQGNVPAGTLVESGITNVTDFDFFMASHEGIQGTTKPAHYAVLKDDYKFSIDELSRMTYELCHLYAKCTRSISLPAPVMYAHLAAERARNYIKGHPLPPTAVPQPPRNRNDQQAQKEYKAVLDGMKAERIQQLNAKIQVPDSLKSTLYYC